LHEISTPDFGSYKAPFVPMVALLSLGAALWLQVDATRDLFPEERPAASVAGLQAGARSA
jgi:hypothetical protein